MAALPCLNSFHTWEFDQAAAEIDSILRFVNATDVELSAWPINTWRQSLPKVKLVFCWEGSNDAGGFERQIMVRVSISVSIVYLSLVSLVCLFCCMPVYLYDFCL